MFRLIEIMSNTFFVLYNEDLFFFKDNSKIIKFNAVNNNFDWNIEINGKYWIYCSVNFLVLINIDTIFIVNKYSGQIKSKKIENVFDFFVDKDTIVCGLEDYVDFLARIELSDLSIERVIKFPELSIRGVYKSKVLLISKINKSKLSLVDLKTGQIVWSWEHNMNPQSFNSNIIFYGNIILLSFSNHGIYALNTNTGRIIWQKPINIDAFDEERGLIYVLENDFIVIDATTGEELIRVKEWSKRQLEKHPALFFISSPCSLSEEYIVFSSRASLDEFGECGVFFIDKETAEVKEYFRIVFDKDPVQRTGWYGNKIPDDQQIPFMPIDKPIYKNGRLYVMLPSPIEGQRDLYIYERE